MLMANDVNSKDSFFSFSFCAPMFYSQNNTCMLLQWVRKKWAGFFGSHLKESKLNC